MQSCKPCLPRSVTFNLLRNKSRKRTIGKGIQSGELFNVLFHKVSQLEQEPPPLCAGDSESPRGLVGFLRSLRGNVDVGFCAGCDRGDDLSRRWSQRQSTVENETEKQTWVDDSGQESA